MKTDNKKWKIVESEYIINNKWLRLKKEKCLLPNSTIINDYYVTEKNDAVMIFAVTKDNKIILVSQYKHAAQDTVLELPAGYVDEKEVIEDAAKRELVEETGYKAHSLEKIGSLFFDPTSTRGTAHIFFTNDIEKISDQKLDITEDIEVKEVSVEQLKKYLQNNEIIGGIAVGAAFIGLEKIKQMNNESNNN